MPKIIDDLRETFILEARRMLQEDGGRALTIRNVARTCHVAVGTVYNYFPSKEALVATFMLTDWNNCIAAIQSCADESDTVEPVLKTIYSSLKLFLQQFAPIFRDADAAASYSSALSKYHSILRNQLAAPIRKFCRDDFTAEFIAEAMLTWTVAGKDFDELKNILLRIN